MAHERSDTRSIVVVIYFALPSGTNKMASPWNLVQATASGRVGEMAAQFSL